jgi:predicted transcriptional regulator
MLTKREILASLDQLPPEARVEDALEPLELLYRIERGIAEGEAGLTVPNDEVMRRASRWLK